MNNKEKMFLTSFGHERLTNEVDTDWLIFDDIWKEAQKELLKKFLDFYKNTIKNQEVINKTNMQIGLPYIEQCIKKFQEENIKK